MIRTDVWVVKGKVGVGWGTEEGRGLRWVG
jgi:hypothetical protein